MSTLALDLGTTTGWCLDPKTRSHGTWDLKPGRFDGGGMRFLRFQRRLSATLEVGDLEQVVYEEVRNHKGVDAAHIYGGLMATLTAWCEDHGIPYEGVPVGTIKRFWAGKGNAGKPEMILAGIKRGFDVKDDNEMDAIALWHWHNEVGSAE